MYFGNNERKLVSYTKKKQGKFIHPEISILSENESRKEYTPNIELLRCKPNSFKITPLNIKCFDKPTIRKSKIEYLIKNWNKHQNFRNNNISIKS